MSEQKDNQETESFDAILEQLRTIVERLESEELPLEESLRAFERGVALSRRGQRILDEAERRVEVLLRDGNTAPLE
jgi:exodeoxyribonuclease VII small subunit